MSVKPEKTYTSLLFILPNRNIFKSSLLGLLPSILSVNVNRAPTSKPIQKSD